MDRLTLPHKENADERPARWVRIVADLKSQAPLYRRPLWAFGLRRLLSHRPRLSAADWFLALRALARQRRAPWP